MKKIGEIKEEFAAASEGQWADLCAGYAEDQRSGVQKIVSQYQKKLENLEKEKLRMEQMMQYEHEYEHLGYLCGIDEVGRGPLAGPVIACAVILPKDHDILYLNDSKKLTAHKREELYDVIMEKAVAVGIGMASPQRIDEINILQATYEAMREAISKLKVTPQLLLNDAVTIPQVTIPQVPIIKGDAKSASIAAASIVAKVTRDRMMVDRFADLCVDVFYCFQNTFSEISCFVTVAEFQCLKFTCRCAAWCCSSSYGTVDQGYFCFYCRISSGIHDLTADDFFNFQIVHDLFTP